jgi:hypothetical protein
MKNVVITGVSSGIGLAITRVFAAAGYKIFGSVRKKEDALRLKEELGEVGTSHVDSKSRITFWEKQLGYVIATYFDSISFVTTRPHPEIYGRYVRSMGFIGHESNRITCGIMYEWLRKTIKRESRKRFDDYAQRQSFCVGVIQSLKEKYLSEKKNEVKNETGLVVYDKVKRFADNMNMKESKSKCPALGSESFGAGKEMGSELSLNRQFAIKGIAYKR